MYVSRARAAGISGDETEEAVTSRVVMLNLKTRGLPGAGEALFGRIASSHGRSQVDYPVLFEMGLASCYLSRDLFKTCH